MIKIILARLKEPSTYAGIAALASVIGYNLDPGLLQNIAAIGTGLSGILAVFIKEGS